MPPTQAGPRRGITNSLSININNSYQAIFGSIYSINIQIRLSSVCHTEIIKEGSKNFFTESVRKRKSPQYANFPPEKVLP